MINWIIISDLTDLTESNNLLCKQIVQKHFQMPLTFNKNFQNFDEILLTEKAYNHVSTAQTGTLHPAPFEDDS